MVFVGVDARVGWVVVGVQRRERGEAGAGADDRAWRGGAVVGEIQIEGQGSAGEVGGAAVEQFAGADLFAPVGETLR